MIEEMDAADPFAYRDWAAGYDSITADAMKIPCSLKYDVAPTAAYSFTATKKAIGPKLAAGFPWSRTKTILRDLQRRD